MLPHNDNDNHQEKCVQLAKKENLPLQVAVPFCCGLNFDLGKEITPISSNLFYFHTLSTSGGKY